MIYPHIYFGFMSSQFELGGAIMCSYNKVNNTPACPVSESIGTLLGKFSGGFSPWVNSQKKWETHGETLLGKHSFVGQ